MAAKPQAGDYDASVGAAATSEFDFTSRQPGCGHRLGAGVHVLVFWAARTALAEGFTRAGAFRTGLPRSDLPFYPLLPGNQRHARQRDDPASAALLQRSSPRP